MKSVLLWLSAALTCAQAQSVLINEINYDPVNATRRIEFIELHNPSSEPVSITGWRLRSAVTMTVPEVTIPPGGYHCLVQDPEAFAAVFPGVGHSGPWTGVLANRGELIELLDANGALVDSVDYRSGFPWPTAAKGGGPSLLTTSMELLHPGLDNNLPGSWRRAAPAGTAPAATPGAANSVLLPSAQAAPPDIQDVRHEPAQPAANTPVVITARVTDPDGVASVNLRYQLVKPGAYIRKTDPEFTSDASWTTLPMKDDGTGGDLAAGDSVYTVTLPPELQVHRRLVRYQIDAVDSGSNGQRVPYEDDEQPNFAYFVYNGVPGWSGAFRPVSFGGRPPTEVQDYPPSLLESIPPWILIANEANVIASQFNSGSDGREFYGTLVYDGVVYDHIQYANRGIGSTYVSGKNKWVLKFCRARNFQARDNWGRPFAETWNSVGLNANSGPWASVHRGSAGVEEASSYRLYELCGVPSLRTTYVHWRVIRREEELHPATAIVSGDPLGSNIRGQYAGDLWGLYLALEPTEGNFLDERGLEDGNIYSIEGNNGDKKHQGPAQPTGASDWSAFRTGISKAGQTEEWYRGNIDLPVLYTFLALNRLIGNVDVRPGDNYRFYHRPTDDRWVILPYDLDMMYIPAHHWGGSMDGQVVAGAPHCIRAISRHPALALEFRNRCREILSLVASDPSPNGGQIGQLIDEYAQMVNPSGADLTWADLDAAMWNIHPRSAGSGANSGQTSHKGNFYRAVYNDGTRGGLGGTQTTNSWRRTLPDPDGDGVSDHESLMQWFVNFATDTYPVDAPSWLRRQTTGSGSSNDSSPYRQMGYGYKYLEWESLFGGYVNANVNPDPALADTSYPDTPAATYVGAPDYPANDLRFRSSDFQDPDGPETFGAVQWRIGEISAPGIPGYDPLKPRIYEIEEVWTSPEIPLTSASVPEIRVPAAAARTGHTYRLRVRHRDSTGRWSYWSPPVQFVVSAPDTASYPEALRISEIYYNPAPVTAEESSHPDWNPQWTEQDFEFVEVYNRSGAPVDLTDIRFTKGIDYDFPDGFSLPAGGTVVVARNPAAFAIRFGTNVPPAPGGYADDSLSNAGEELKLSFGAGIAIHEFVFDDEPPWPPEADGSGPSLTLIHPSKNALNHGIPGEWAARPPSPGSVEPSGGGGTGSYEEWAASHPGTGDPMDDSDGDGLVNWLEFALAGDPLAGSPEILPAPGQAEGYATLTFNRPASLSGIVHEVQFSTDLTNWTIGAVLVSETPNDDGTLRQTWRSEVPLSGGGRLYGRLRVAAP